MDHTSNHSPPTEQKIESVFILNRNGKTFVKIPKECVPRLMELSLLAIYCVLHAGNYYIGIEAMNDPEVTNVLQNTPIQSDNFLA